MKKLLLSLLVFPFMSYAASLDMNNLKCRDMALTSATTLGDVQDSCLISEQYYSYGRFAVDFRNDATGDSVTCYFGSNNRATKLNGCK